MSSLRKRTKDKRHVTFLFSFHAEDGEDVVEEGVAGQRDVVVLLCNMYCTSVYSSSLRRIPQKKRIPNFFNTINKLLDIRIIFEGKSTCRLHRKSTNFITSHVGEQWSPVTFLFSCYRTLLRVGILGVIILRVLRNHIHVYVCVFVNIFLDPYINIIDLIVYVYLYSVHRLEGQVLNKDMQPPVIL
jgi:hypothetical protein